MAYKQLGSDANVTQGDANSGGTNTFLYQNTSNTASSNALLNIAVAGTTANDAFQTFTVTGTTNWSQGVDNSVTGDPYVLAASTALGTTNVMSSLTTGEINYPLQPAFLTYLTTTITNVAGSGAAYTIIFDTEVFDQNADFNLGTSTFTAPVTGRYQFDLKVSIIGGTTITAGSIRITTSNLSYQTLIYLTIGSTASAQGVLSILADMDAADTTTFLVTTTDTGLIDDVEGLSGGLAVTFASGYLAC